MYWSDAVSAGRSLLTGLKSRLGDGSRSRFDIFRFREKSRGRLSAYGDLKRHEAGAGDLGRPSRLGENLLGGEHVFRYELGPLSLL